LLYNKHFNVIDLANAGYTSTKLDSIYKGLITITSIDSLSIAINSAIPVYQKADTAFLFGRNINLTISGVTGSHLGIEYLIDSTHNNVIYKFDSLLTTGYTRASATSFLYPNSTIMSNNTSITDSIYSFHIQPNAVVLFEFYIAGISGISNNYQKLNNFAIYPNPTSESLTIIFSSQQNEHERINIYNSMGTIVKTVATNKSETVINVSELPSGLYFIQLNNYPQQTQKFIKQ
jgi:hypothetical protein